MINLSTKIDLIADRDNYPARIYLSEDQNITQDFLKFKEYGTQNEGFTDEKKRMVIKA